MSSRCPPGCIPKRCPSGTKAVSYCRSVEKKRSSQKQNNWKKEEVARLYHALSESDRTLTTYFDNLEKFEKLSLNREGKDDLDGQLIGELYRDHVRGHIWAKAVLPECIEQTMHQMIDPENILARPDPVERFENIVSSFTYAREVRRTPSILNSVLRICIRHWEKPKYNTETLKKLGRKVRP